jgi:sulfite reductase (NADPH) flavoprotein alpha-component
VLPEANGVSRFFESLEHAHRGMWLAGPLGTAMRVTLAYCALMLIFMALSGLYLRWPKSRKLDWRTWFKIHFKLGPAFLWSTRMMARVYC